MAQRTVLFLRVLQTVLAVANLALAATVYNSYIKYDNHASPGALGFLIFAPSFSLCSVLYLELARSTRAVFSHQLLSLGIEGMNSIFYFAGFIAYALFLTDLSFCDGAICTMARATAVIAAAEFSSWIFSTIIATKDWFQSESAKAVVLDDPMQQV